MTFSSSLEFRGREEWRRWLEENHAREKEIWVIIQKKQSKQEGVRYEEAVDEAICFGWIDSKMQRVDANRFRQRFSPRKKNSIWSKINKGRAEKMILMGLMTKAGHEAIEEAKRNGMWDSAYTSKTEPVTPVDLIKALKEDNVAHGNWENFSNSVKLMYIHWIESAKREETRTTRIIEVVRRAAENIRPS